MSGGMHWMKRSEGGRVIKYKRGGGGSFWHRIVFVTAIVCFIKKTSNLCVCCIYFCFAIFKNAKNLILLPKVHYNFFLTWTSSVSPLMPSMKRCQETFLFLIRSLFGLCLCNQSKKQKKKKFLLVF